MFVHPDFRGKGISKLILNELENWAIELGNYQFILETSIKLITAMELYQKSGYLPTENYGQYIGVASSYCMKKVNEPLQ